MIVDKLVNYGRAQFILNKRQDDGATLRDHLVSGWRQKNFNPNYKPEELKYSELEEYLIPTFKVFGELGGHRQWAETGPRALAWTDMQAWQDVRRSRLEPWQLDAILRLDNAFLEVWFEK